MFDFQWLRTNADIASAPILAASIFLDILNVFQFFLLIFSSPWGSDLVQVPGALPADLDAVRPR